MPVYDKDKVDALLQDFMRASERERDLAAAANKAKSPTEFYSEMDKVVAAHDEKMAIYNRMQEFRIDIPS